MLAWDRNRLEIQKTPKDARNLLEKWEVSRY